MNQEHELAPGAGVWPGEHSWFSRPGQERRAWTFSVEKDQDPDLEVLIAFLQAFLSLKPDSQEDESSPFGNSLGCSS